MNFKNFTREQLIILIQLVLKIMGKKKTFEGLLDPKAIVVHHGAGDFTFEQVDIYHRRKWGFESSLGYYAGYHYFIEFNGKVYQARQDTEEAAHTVSAAKKHYWNRNSIGICLQGNTENKIQTDEQVRVLKGLIEAKQLSYDIPNSKVYGHRDISPTLCPGRYLYKWLKVLTK